jgi:hypothetical protein
MADNFGQKKTAAHAGGGVVELLNCLFGRTACAPTLTINH